MAAKRHRKRQRVRTKYNREYQHTRHQVRPLRRDRIIGIDGEGQGRSPHIYTYLAGVDEKGIRWSVENRKGLRTKQCLDFLLSLPDRSLVMGFALGYDQTKWLADLPNFKLFELFHEETRMFIRDGRVLYHPVRWKGYKLNYCNRRFSVSKGTRHTAVWDIFAFFQARFTKALADWKAAPQEVIDWIQAMKERRNQFDKLDSAKVKEYCQQECGYLAKLARMLIDAHHDVGLPLKKFHGAGSTASAFLQKIKVKRKRGTYPEAMKHAIACAFFGGRFENSCIGPIKGPVYSYDISSAYPYQATFLPCLQHGRWELVSSPGKSTIASATLALCHWHIPQASQSAPWGTLPVRAPIVGTIAFPTSALGGWCWKAEYQVSAKLTNVSCSEAWLYHTDCDCAPFKSIPRYYLERLKLGKEGRGIVIKLGLNSIYGKLAQSKGVNPPFQSWIWAGNITSGTRAQLLESLLVAKNPWDILMFATDSVASKVPLKLPKPRDTGTDITVDYIDENGKPAKTRKPLGGWEEKVWEKGVFCVRPGIYFPQEPTDKEIEKVRARGLGRKTVYDKWHEIVSAWEWEQEGVSIGGFNADGEPYLARFVGAKSAISKSGSKERPVYRRSENYGEWIPHEINVSFSPWPKRQSKMRYGRLKTWLYMNWESEPYSNALENPEADMLAKEQAALEEQPDGADYARYA